MIDHHGYRIPGAHMHGRTFVIYAVCFILVLICFIASVSAADNPPVADFSLSAGSGAVPFTVTITDTSTDNPTSWEWYIDNQLYDVKPGPFTLTFKKTGTFTIGPVRCADGDNAADPAGESGNQEVLKKKCASTK
jgi:hypothetical protein